MSLAHSYASGYVDRDFLCKFASQITKPNKGNLHSMLPVISHSNSDCYSTEKKSRRAVSTHVWLDWHN